LSDGQSSIDPFDRSAAELDELAKNLLMDVKKYGFHIVLVGGEDPSHDHPPVDPPLPPYSWAYSVGLHYSYAHPEVVTFGLSDQTLGWMISTIGKRIGVGERFEPGQNYWEIIQGHTCTFIPVAKRAYQEFIGFATWFYKGDDFPVLQCIWPDHQSRYPWHPCSQATTQQPDLLDEDSPKPGILAEGDI
jgi:hypothetical protein